MKKGYKYEGTAENVAREIGGEVWPSYDDTYYVVGPHMLLADGTRPQYIYGPRGFCEKITESLCYALDLELG